MDIIKTDKGLIDKTNTMYPSALYKITNDIFVIPKMSSVFGVVISGNASYKNKTINKFEYFCLTEPNEKVIINGTTVFFVRYGFIGQQQIGGPVEQSGRLVYIDGCSDSLLVYPPRMGDPSLNLLSFPEQINQTFHIHPSIRLGVVLEGEGYSNILTNGTEESIDLVSGIAFCINERELHRFRTTYSTLKIIAYHPDGDWGPTDENHPMKNRTLILK